MRFGQSYFCAPLTASLLLICWPILQLLCPIILSVKSPTISYLCFYWVYEYFRRFLWGVQVLFALSEQFSLISALGCVWPNKLCLWIVCCAILFTTTNTTTCLAIPWTLNARYKTPKKIPHIEQENKKSQKKRNSKKCWKLEKSCLTIGKKKVTQYLSTN